MLRQKERDEEEYMAKFNIHSKHKNQRIDPNDPEVQERMRLKNMKYFSRKNKDHANQEFDELIKKQNLFQFKASENTNKILERKHKREKSQVREYGLQSPKQQIDGLSSINQTLN